MTTLAGLTALCMDDPITEHVHVSTVGALVDAVTAVDVAGRPLLVVGGGLNPLVPDAPFKGTIADMQPFNGAASVIREDPTGPVVVYTGADTVWSAFISWTLSEGLRGLEALSGIPGAVGASPMQSMGTYDREVPETTESVKVYDRLTDVVARLPPSDLGFAYRSSVTRRSVGEPGLGDRPWGSIGHRVVLSVSLRLVCSPLSASVMYAELARRFGVEAGERADASLVRSTVLDLHRGKDVILDAEGHDTWSVSPPFMNPILPEAVATSLPKNVSYLSVDEDLLKTNAAWLIDHANCGKDSHLPEVGDPPRASLSTGHVLALTNHGGVAGAGIEALAHTVCGRVFDAFGVILMPEPVTTGIAW